MDNPPHPATQLFPLHFTLYPFNPFNPFNLFNLFNQRTPMKRLALLLPLLALAAAPARAKLGYDADDPIRTVDVAGEYKYLARLRGADGAEVSARRYGSTFIAGFDAPMDVWKLTCGSNSVDVYIYGYGPTNSLAAPEGFSLLPEDASGLVEPPRNTSFSIDPDGTGAVAIFDDDTPTVGSRRSRRARRPAPGEWPGLDDKAALVAWSESVRTNENLFTSARFRDERLLPLLRREALEPLLSGPDKDAEWIGEAKQYVERELWFAWFDNLTNRPNPDWGRAYDFTVKMGSKDPFLSWMSVVGQHKWHWDDGARKQLAGMEEAAAASGTPFQRLLAAHARNVLDPSDERAAALRAAAVAWAESCAGRPEETRAVYKVLAQFLEVKDEALREALAASGADPWLALVIEGRLEIDRGWDDRGSGWASTVTEEGWKGFGSHLEKAKAALEKAWALHPEFPEAAKHMITVAGGGCAGADEDQWFGRALAAQIDDRESWIAYRWFNYPRWGGSHARLRRLAEAALATDRHDAPVAFWYGPLLASICEDSEADDHAFFAEPGVAEAMEKALAPQLGNDGADRWTRLEASGLLGPLRYRRGDFAGAIEANRARRGLTSHFSRVAMKDWLETITVLDGLSGPNGERIAPLYKKYADKDWAACAAEADAVWDACRGLEHEEAGLLATIAAEAWVETGFAAGEPRFFGMLRKRQFCDWLNYGSGFTLEEKSDDGAGLSRDGEPQWLELQYAVPSSLEAAGAFEPWGEADAPHMLLVRLGASRHRFDGPVSPSAVFVREKGRAGVFFAPAAFDDGTDLAAKALKEGAAADPGHVVWRDLPEGEPLRWRVVFAAGGVLAFLGDDAEPAAALGGWADDDGDPVTVDEIPGRAALWFGHRNVRFLGVTVRKPDDEDAARAAELGAAASEKAAAEKAAAEAAKKSEDGRRGPSGISSEDWIEFSRLWREASKAAAAGDHEKAAALFAEAVGKLDGKDNVPFVETSLNGLAWELHLLGRDAEALPYARRALAAADDDNPYAVAVGDTLGAVLVAVGETAEARKVLEEAIERADHPRGWTPRVVKKELANSRGHLRFHLAQCLDREGDAAGAKALLDALRGEGFVPDAPEDAAYEALAGKLGAAPLAPRTPPGPAARLRVSSRSDLEAALNGGAAAAGDPMLGVQASMAIQEAMDEFDFPGFDPSRPVVAWFLSGELEDTIVAVPGDEIPDDRLAEGDFPGFRGGGGIVRDGNGVATVANDPRGNAYFHHDGLNVFLTGPDLYPAATSLLSNAAEPRFPFAAVEVEFAPDAVDELAPFGVFDFDPAALGAVRVGVGFDETDGLLLGFSVAPTNPVPDAPPLDPAAILYREGADLNFAVSDWSRVFPWLPELVERINERDADLLPGWRDVAGERGEDADRRDRELDAAVVRWFRVLADCGAASASVSAVPGENACTVRSRVDYRTAENAARERDAVRRRTEAAGPEGTFRETDDGWGVDADYTGSVLHPGNSDWKHLFGNRFHSEVRLVPGTVATYDKTSAAPGAEIPPPAGAPDFGPFSKRFDGLVPAAHIEFDLAAWAPRVAAPRKLPDGLPAHARATLDLASRGGEVLGLLRLDPACLRLLHDLSPLRTPDGEDAEFDD